MPIYEYRCKACGKVKEVLQKIDDPPPKKCPACGGALEKLISRSSFQLKGSGWYVTDYARKSSGGDSGESSSKDSGSSDSTSKSKKSASAGSDSSSGSTSASSSKGKRSGGKSSE